MDEVKRTAPMRGTGFHFSRKKGILVKAKTFFIAALFVSFCFMPHLCGQDRSSISGHLLGCDGRPMKKAQVHLIVPWEKFDHLILTSVDVGPDGAFKLEFDRTGTFMVYFTGVDHLNLELPLVVDKPQALSVSVRLRSLLVPPDLKDVGIIGDFNAFSKYASVPMTRQADGTFCSEFDAKPPTFSYQIMGPFGPLGKLMAVNGTQSDDYIFDSHYLASYKSVIRTPESGKVRIVFDPGKIRQCAFAAEFHFEGNPLLEKFARISMAVAERAGNIRRVKAEEEKSGTGRPGLHDDWAKEIIQLETRLAGEKEPLLRQSMLIGYLRLAQTAGAPLDPRLCRMAFDEIPPASTLWDLDPWVLHPAGAASGSMVQYEAYLEKALKENPDPNLKAAMIYGELQAAREPAKARMLIDRLTREYPNSRFTDSAQTTLSPDKKILVGRKIPAFSLPSLDDPNTVYTKDGLKGKYVLIDFWATWCVVCVGEMENVHKAYAQFKGRNFEILSVSLDVKPQNVALFRRNKWPMPWNHAFLEGGIKNTIARDFELDGLPRLILIDPEGMIIALDEDLRGHRLEVTLARYLSEGSATTR
jgi:thiol-disulfide isomerase/thioredoxin